MDIRPKGSVRLIGHVGSEIRQTVTIIPEKKFQFKIIDATAKKGKNITYELAEQKPDSNGYVLTVVNKKQEKGRYFDTISLKTTSKIRPQIHIRVYGDVRVKKEQPTGK